MPRPCDVVGCPNGPRNLAKGKGNGESNVTYHRVPTSEPLRSKWLSAVPLLQLLGKEPKNRVVCSLHFLPEDYELNADLLKSSGVPIKAILSRSAVPSVLPAFSEAQEQLQDEDGAAERSESQASASTVDTSYKSDVQATRDAGTDASLSSSPAEQSCSSVGNTKSVQVRLPGNSIGVQVNTTMKETKEKGTQVCRRRKPVTSTPVKRRYSARRADGAKRRRQTSRQEASFLTSPDASPVACKADRHDTTYEPDNSTCTLDATLADESDEDAHANRKDYFLVHSTCLVTLLSQCRTCLSASCTVKLFYTGTRITAETECPHAHVHTWSSQPLVGTKPRGNIDLATALLFSGSSPTSALRMMRLMGVQVMSDQAFFNYQKAYLLPSVTTVWDEHQKSLLTELSDTSLQLCGDGRCDSPGYSAKFLSYSFLCPKKRKIVHTEQVQVKESEQVQASAQMEKEGLVRGLNFLSEQGVTVGSLTTDRHSGIKKHMRLQHPDIDHHFDVWHVAKGIRKKLTAASRRAGCSAITEWTQAITNHLYWCACACGGNGDMLVAAWSSMLNHIKNRHEGHGGLYPRCLHGQSRRMRWLTADSPAYKQIERIVAAPLLLKDIRQLSPSVQTYSLESFHSVLNGFAPKSTAFTYEGMKARTLIAALHFNENSQREQGRSCDGAEQWRVKSSKVRQSTSTACALKTAPTFGKSI
ncbi:uncharacterized protein [Dermacentor albipictus]|uniref:uncharacterized protein n=1 Tax=Dermacentor albipictus TaxID=60249 RepID=UPI0038FCB666